jgi:cyanophycinase
VLALVGSGEYLHPMEPVDRFLLEQVKGTPEVVCLATAAGTEGEERIRYWSELGKAHFSKLGAQVEAPPVIDQPSANIPEYARIIQQSNFVYLSGGKPDYLFRTLSGSLVWGAIMDVLQRGGVVAGCSAGAMIMGEYMPGFPGLKPGFGLLKGVFIMPHFDEIPSVLTGTLHALVGRNQTLIGIEGNTALVGFDKDWQVVGSKGVVVWTTKEKRRYTHGEPVYWE